MTEGHFKEMHQRNSRVSVNCIELIVKLIDSLMGNLNEWNFNIIPQALDTLTEFVQGPCLENQKAISDRRLLEIMRKILKVGQF